MKIFRIILSLLFLAAFGIIMFVTLKGNDGVEGIAWTIVIAAILTLAWGWRLSQADGLFWGGYWMPLLIVKLFNFVCWIAVLAWSVLALIVSFSFLGNSVVLGVIMLVFTLVPWILRMSSPSLRAPA